MKFSIDLRLTSLRCVQPDETEEDPYLWTFFFQLDGNTVRQLNPGDFRLISKIHIAAGNGEHKNLSSSTAVAGQILQIPDNVGFHHAELRPIRFSFAGQTISVPGRLIAFVVLLDEDVTSDASIVKANTALREFLENQWNDFITNQLTQAAVTTEAGIIRQTTPELSGEPLFMAAIESLINKFTDSLEGAAADIVQEAVIEDSNVFELLFNFVDKDDSMGTLKMAFNEKQIIDAGFQIPIHDTIIRKEDEQWTAYHEIYGSLTAILEGSESDLVSQTAQGNKTLLRQGAHVIDIPLVCINPGTAIRWNLYGINWEENILFTYPYLNVRWSIENAILNQPAGIISLDTTSGFPKFNPSQPPHFSTSLHRPERVQIRYELEDQGDKGKMLKLFNDPQDGNYSFIVTAVGVTGNGREIEIGKRMVSFTGQAIEIEPKDFVTGYQRCMEEFNRRFTKSRKAGIKDLWSPHSRFAEYEKLISMVDEVAAAKGIKDAQVVTLKKAIANKLQVKINL